MVIHRNAAPMPRSPRIRVMIKTVLQTKLPLLYRASQRFPRAKAASPVVNHAPPAPAPTRTPTPQQRQQSSYPATQSSLSHQRKQSSQSGKNQQAPSVSRPSTTGPTRNQSPPARTQQSYSVIPTDARPATVPNVNSIANLVTNQDRQASPAYPSPTEESTSTTFINPREVFNPYHREHERVRREAAAAEAAAKRKAAEAACDSQICTST